MKLPIYNENYLLGGDTYSYKLYRKVTAKKAEEALEANEDGIDASYTVICYPSTIKSAYKRIVEMEKRNTATTTWEGYFKHLQKIEETLEADIERLSALIGADTLLENAMRVSSEVMSIGEEKAADTDKPKRGRKKKAEA